MFDPKQKFQIRRMALCDCKDCRKQPSFQLFRWVVHKPSGMGLACNSFPEAISVFDELLDIERAYMIASNAKPLEANANAS